ncbi:MULTISPECIES: hypothetical protein [unclassified Nocardioides]|uniref:hypothetical protein n=1 Tax=unclassified Nocardioides TaxID=2615069 RepID=UPI0006F33C7D|nr:MULTISPECIES: hypothetical protein [unclassified Nocardioides]KQY64522.1 hypothetical protein ASD30_06275 [Nocardioides sp. Root140]KRF18317.1 hypothetical protein ASH02_01800 [Nocardioides sp. Soil796]
MKINKLILVVLVVPGLATTLVACGNDGGSDDDTAGSDTNTGPLAVRSVGSAGDVYVDADGRAVYVAEEEKSGKVLCTDSCLDVWKPVIASGSATTGDFGTLTRPDTDEKQVTFEGAPVYTFTLEGSGEVTGNDVTDEFDGVSFTWHVVDAGGAAPSDTSSSPDTGNGYDY